MRLGLVREIVEHFEQHAPIAFMARMIIEHALPAGWLDRLFEKTAQRQSNRQLLFSSVWEIMGMVALRVKPSVYAGYRTFKKRLGVTAKAVYHKCNRPPKPFLTGVVGSHAWACTK